MWGLACGGAPTRAQSRESVSSVSHTLLTHSLYDKIYTQGGAAAHRAHQHHPHILYLLLLVLRKDRRVQA
jgi:hypothetical protein